MFFVENSRAESALVVLREPSEEGEDALVAGAEGVAKIGVGGEKALSGAPAAGVVGVGGGGGGVHFLGLGGGTDFIESLVFGGLAP